MEDKIWTVYKHTTPNNKVYIGITSLPVHVRWRNEGQGYKRQPFYNAIQKYGWNNIKHEVLFSELTKEEAEEKEIELIKKYKSLLSENGYNSATGGFVNKGFHLTRETKEKLRIQKLGSKHTIHTKKLMSQQRCGEKAYWHGKKLSIETRQKISLAKTGKKGILWTEERKKEMSQKMSGSNNPMYGKKQCGENNGMYGKKHTEETKALLKIKHKGANNGNSRSVYQYDLNMNLIKKWNYIGEAVEVLGLPKNAKNGIISCCRYRQKTAYGYKWKYE